MKNVIAQILISATLILILIVAFKIIRYNINFSQQKISTFECGFDLITKLRLPFSLNFFIIAIIFLIFDVELILLLPFIFTVKITKRIILISIIVCFFTILIVGFLYEWWIGLLNWLI